MDYYNNDVIKVELNSVSLFTHGKTSLPSVSCEGPESGLPSLVRASEHPHVPSAILPVL